MGLEAVFWWVSESDPGMGAVPAKLCAPGGFLRAWGGRRAGEEKGRMGESSLVNHLGNVFSSNPSLQSVPLQMPSPSPSFLGCCVPPGMACSWTALNRSIRRKPKRQVRLGAGSRGLHRLPRSSYLCF